MEIEKDKAVPVPDDHQVEEINQPEQKFKENPMLNSLVLKTIFDLCHASDLKTFRLVCHSWNDVAFPVLKQLADCNASAFVDVKEPVSDLPFQSFILTRPPMEFSTLNMVNVWNNCGNWMTSLKVYAGRIKDLDTLRDIVYRRTPQLQHLDLNCVIAQNVHKEYRKHHPEFAPEGTAQLNMKSLIIGVGRKGFPVKPVQLMRIFPNLENLRLLTRRDNVHNITNMLEGLSILRNKDKSNFSNFKGLDIIAANSKHDLNVSIFLKNFLATWEGTPVPLQTLAFDVGSVSKSEEIRNILSTCNTTLKSLDLYRSFTSSVLHNMLVDVTFPNLKVFRTTNMACDSFEFLRFMPCLEVLHLADITLMYVDLENTQGKSQPDIEDLNMSYGSELMTNLVCSTVQEFHCGYGCDRDDISKMSKWMPNLKKLIIPLTNDGGLRVICENWSKLTCLTIVVGVGNADLCAISKLKYLKSCIVEPVNEIHESWKQTKANSLQLSYSKKSHRRLNQFMVGIPMFFIDL